MITFNDLLFRMRALFRRKAVEAELDEELRFHFERQVDACVGSGLSRREAVRLARLRFGGCEQVKEECRDARGVGLVENAVKDIRFALRMLAKNTGFTVIAVLTLALGIGANTAIFSVVNSVLFNPLPFPRPERLVRVYQASPARDVLFGAVSPPDFEDWRDRCGAFESIGAYFSYEINVTGGGEPLAVTGTYGSPGFFDALGVSALIGRTFTPEENRPGPDRVVVLSYGFWQRRFGGALDVVGRKVILDSRPFTIIGVMPATFRYPSPETGIWVPLSLITEDMIPRRRGIRWLSVIARLRSESSLAAAQAEMNTIADGLSAQYPETNAESNRAAVSPLKDRIVGDTGPALIILLAAVGLVLLISCANVANLLLARSSARHKEMSIRMAIGASRMRIICQLLTESILLAVAGGGLGLVLAFWGLDSLLAVFGEGLPRAGEIRLDGRTLLFALSVSMLTGILFGLAPALKLAGSNLQASLKEGGRTSEPGRYGLRGALVVSEIALAVILVTAAGLMIHSLWRLFLVDPGFNPENVLTVSFRIPPARFNDPAQLNQYYRRILRRVSELPGVTAVGGIKTLPLEGEGEPYEFTIAGRPGSPSGEVARTEVFPVSEGYFQAMGIPLLSGRVFTERDMGGDPPVVIVNEAMARRYWPQEDPVGRQVRAGGTALQIVGVVGDVKQESLNTEQKPSLYAPHTLFPRSAVTLVLRGVVEAQKLVAPVRGAVWSVDKDQPISEIATMQQVVSSSISRPRLYALLLGLFAGLAMLLSALGIYGVVSYFVNQRTHEVGIRMALGARRLDILRLVIRRSGVLILAGLVIGFFSAGFLTRFLSGMLFGVGATDPLTFLIVGAVLGAAALLASYLPARRATRVDPLIALRYE